MSRFGPNVVFMQKVMLYGEQQNTFVQFSTLISKRQIIKKDQFLFEVYADNMQ